jgi:hypothetical protein
VILQDITLDMILFGVHERPKCTQPAACTFRLTLDSTVAR